MLRRSNFVLFSLFCNARQKTVVVFFEMVGSIFWQLYDAMRCNQPFFPRTDAMFRCTFSCSSSCCVYTFLIGHLDPRTLFVFKQIRKHEHCVINTYMCAPYCAV